MSSTSFLFALKPWMWSKRPHRPGWGDDWHIHPAGSASRSHSWKQWRPPVFCDEILITLVVLCFHSGLMKPYSYCCTLFTSDLLISSFNFSTNVSRQIAGVLYIQLMIMWLDFSQPFSIVKLSITPSMVFDMLSTILHLKAASTYTAAVHHLHRLYAVCLGSSQEVQPRVWLFLCRCSSERWVWVWGGGAVLCTDETDSPSTWADKHTAAQNCIGSKLEAAESTQEMPCMLSNWPRELFWICSCHCSTFKVFVFNDFHCVWSSNSSWLLCL